MKRDLTEIKVSLSDFLEHYVTREEIEARYERLQTEIDKRFDGVNKRVDGKANKEEVTNNKDSIKFLQTKMWQVGVAVAGISAGVTILTKLVL